jgi:hypothetical protein
LTIRSAAEPDGSGGFAGHAGYNVVYVDNCVGEVIKEVIKY